MRSRKKRLAGEDEGEGAFPVEAIGGEQAQVLERIVGEEMRFIEDDDGAFGKATQVGDKIVGGLAFEAACAQALQRRLYSDPVSAGSVTHRWWVTGAARRAGS
jgi:hypothetical protein